MFSGKYTIVGRCIGLKGLKLIEKRRLSILLALVSIN